MSPVDYNKLRTFVLVAERQSITLAAQALGRTQSAITQQIQLLEEGLGMKLLERRHARVQLTREGECLFAASREWLSRIDDEVARLQDNLERLEGRVRVGVLEDFGTYRLVPLLARFHEQHPRARINLVYATSRELEAALLGNEVEVALLPLFEDKSPFEILPLTTDDHILVTSPGYLERFGPVRSAERLLEAALVDFSEDFLCLAAWVRKNAPSLLPRLLDRTPAVVLQSHLGIKSLLASGFGVALLPRYVAEEELARGELVTVLKASKPVRVGTDLARKKVRSPRLLEQRFVQFVRAGLRG